MGGEVVMLIPPDGIRKMRRLRKEAQQIVNDVSYWNTHRPEESPIDCEIERLVVALCGQGIKAAIRGDGDEYSRITGELVRVTSPAASAEAGGGV